ncbi:hypothetical protein Hanom_Chr03g00212041 [Helianthus anomalus]
MSSTIFSSLTTFFSGIGHHSPPHPTISSQPTIPHTKSIHHALSFSTSSTRGSNMVALEILGPSRVIHGHHGTITDRPHRPKLL